MLRALPPLLLAVCLLLLAEDCAHAAAEAFALWWSSVLPALFPFYLCTSLLLRSGAAQSLVRLLRPVSRLLCLPQGVLPCLLLGGVAGYPTGARLCASLGAAQYGARCSLCSPMFLIALVGGGLLRGGGSAPLLCLAHYGAALLLLASFLTRYALYYRMLAGLCLAIAAAGAFAARPPHAKPPG